MVNYILFLRALLAHVDRLQALFGERWPDQLARLNRLLNDLLSESNEDTLPARVNRIYRCFEETPAEVLARALFQQASEQARRTDSSTRSMIVTDPTTQRSRSVDLGAAGALRHGLEEGLNVTVAELTEVASELSQSVNQAMGANEKLETQNPAKRINAWISERITEPSRPLDIGERYTLNLSVGKEIAGSLIAGKDPTVLKEDLTGGGLQTEWVVSTAAFGVSSDDPSIDLSAEPPSVQTAKFSLWIPENGDSEVRRLFIVPSSRDNARLQILIFAIRAEQRELYRTFTIDVPVEDSASTALPASGIAVINDLICASSGHMNLRTTHEWTTPPGRLMLTVLPGLQQALVNGDLLGRQVNDFVEWFGQQATLSGPIDNVRAAAENFRNKWGGYLNDIDPQDLVTRLSQFVPTYTWANWKSRADSDHTKTWLDTSGSDELRKLAKCGNLLYRTVFRPDKQLRSWIDSLPPGSRLDINWKVDDPGSGTVPNVPWGLMYQFDPPAPGKAVDPMGFLALRFRLGYWGYRGVSDASKALGAIADAHQAYCLYWGKDQAGVEAAWQRQRFQQWKNRVFVPEISDAPNARDEVLQAFEAPKHSPTSVLYFFCHAAFGDGNEPILRFGPTNGPADVLQTTDLTTGKDLVDKPLVFANACTTSSADPYVANLLQQDLFQRGCRGFLGTETKVPIQLASRFAEIFFHFFYRKVDPAPMAAGEALAQTRLFLLTEYGNIGGIFYAYLNQYELYMASDSEVAALRI